MESIEHPSAVYSATGTFSNYQPQFMSSNAFGTYKSYNGRENPRFATSSGDAFGYVFHHRDVAGNHNSAIARTLQPPREAFSATSTQTVRLPAPVRTQTVSYRPSSARDAPDSSSSEVTPLSSPSPLSQSRIPMGTRRPSTPPMNRPGPLPHHREAKAHHSKESISRSQRVGERLTHHIPGYQGYVPTEPFRFSETYGRTTQRAISSGYRHPWVYNKSSLALTLSPTVQGVYKEDRPQVF